MPDVLSQRQQRTLAARQAFANRFSTPQEQTEYFSALARRAAAGRVVLTTADASVLAEAYAVLARIAERTRQGEGGAS